MKKLKVIAFLLIVVFATSVGCAGYIDIPEPVGRIPFTSDINDALVEATTPILPPEENENMGYHVIIDSRLCNSATGFFGANCVSFKKALSHINDSLYNKDVTGYYTSNKYTVRDENNKPAGTAVYKKCDNVFQQASLNKLADSSPFPAEVIADIASKVNDDMVCVFVTDLAMPKEGDQYTITEALESVITQPNMTVGLIGFKADYSAKVMQNLPSIVTQRGLDLPSGKIYQRNAYVLVMGEKRAVFNMIDNFMKSCESDGTFSGEGKAECVYYFKYSCDSTVDVSTLKAGQQFVSLDYSEAVQKNMTENNKYSYDYNYVFMDVPEDENTILRLQKMPLSKIYSGAKKLSESDSKVRFVFDYPFEVTTGVGKPTSKKLGDASAPLDLNQMEYSASSQISVYSSSSWVNAETRGLYVESDAVEVDGNKIAVIGSLDFSKMELDNPLIYRARLSVNINDVPEESITRGYDVSWLEDWQMDATVIKTQWMKDAAYEESMKTPYVNEIFGQSLVSYAASENRNSLLKSSSEYVQTSTFGLVLREQVLSYNRDKDWKDEEDFGWAFSRNDVLAIASR